jgi:Glycosyltransferase
VRILSPHCGIAPESGSGGEVYERELLKDLASLGEECHVLLARGKSHERVPGLTIHPVWPPKGLRWYVTPFVWPRYIKRVWDAQKFDVLRAHSVRFVGPAALWARRHYGLPVPVVTHHHHLDPSPLNPVLEKRVIEASDCVITDSQFAKRQLAEELGVRTDHVRSSTAG